MVKLIDIAKELGVSVSTVSRSLSNSSEIGEETRNKVKAMAAKLNYIQNYSARSLAGGTSKSIGIILPEISSNFYVQIVEYTGAILKSEGYSLILGISNHNFKDEIQFLNEFRNKEVDGIIIAGETYEDIVPELRNIKEKYNLPVVLIDTFVSSEECDYIMIDDALGINSAISYLKESGHETIGFIGDEISAYLRFDFFKNALKQSGLKYYDRYSKIGKERFELGGYLQMKELLKEKDIPTAVFASYDNFAFGAIKAINEAGLKIPDDISIVGFDNIRESEYFAIPLTTVSAPIKEMCQIGVKLLLNKIVTKDHKLIQHVSLKPELVIRDTVKNIRP